MKNSVLCLLLIGVSFFSLTAAVYAQSPGYEEDYKAAAALQEALKNNERQKVAVIISYPLKRAFPLSEVTNPQEFLAQWDEFFDAELIERLTKQQPEEMGWRGVMLEHGCVWFSEGKISALNCETEEYKKAWEAAKQKESNTLYRTARNYDALEFECRTDSLHIRAQRHGKNLRYFAWKNGQSLATKPQLALQNGVYDFQGSGGNHNLIFSNPPYVYTLEVTRLCGDDCNSYIVVSKGKEEISRRACKE